MNDPHCYSIRPLDAAAHLFEVRLTVAKPDEAGQIFAMPAWIPGSYMIRDYARHVVAIRAEAGGVGLAVSKLDKSRWQTAPTERSVTLVLEIYAHDESVRGAHLDSTHAYFNGPCVFPAVVGQEDVTCEVAIGGEDLPEARHWRVATSMNRAGAEPYGFGQYVANDYAELIDHPVEIAALSIGEFQAGGIPHVIAIRGRTKADMARLCHDLSTLCCFHMKMLGTPRDLDRYVFLLYAPGSGYGGLEHRWSSSLVSNRDSLPIRGDEGISPEYRTFLGLVSHEYFHLWNVTRMKPAVFTPHDLSQESHTELLWVFEGITSYYDDLALVRSGLIPASEYLELVGQTITRVIRGQGRRRQSVAESSFDAWTKFYKQDANAGNAIVSYYAKGSLIALALDLKIRSETEGRISLDDVMRVCWDRWGETGKGMPERGLEEVSSEVSGLDLGDFFDAAVRGTGELALEQLLNDHGVKYCMRKSQGRKDKGGDKVDDGKLPNVWLGAILAARSETPIFASLSNGGPAERAGVSPGDELVALDGVRANVSGSDTRFRRYRPGDKSELTVFRGDELLTLKLTWAEAPNDTCYLEVDADANETATKHRENWLAAR
ncbi:MAG: PDZ domain-containing protein [Gammaproteobacteria bacterium]|jgi:predicted metalloprotease with PDZ domain|nr:PDZ domain-containing protein [Gammaproteobacteria bacterium]